MARYKHYDYSQSVLIPLCLEDQIMPGTLEFAIHTLVEERIDTSIFDEKYNNDETGRSAYDPKILLKIVLLAYSRGLNSSRKIEKACKENIAFMALSCGQRPDHSTIATFVSCMKDEIVPLFRDVLLVCEEMNLLGGTMFALDGCKLPSNASKEWSGTISDLQKKKDKVEQKVAQLLGDHVETDRKAKDDEKDGGPSGRSNRKKQIERLKKNAERIEKFLKENAPKIGRIGKEIKSNVTDNESANMLTSHGVIQGYNGQALVDSEHQVIVHAEVFGEGQDNHHVPPMLDGAKENLEALGHGEDYFAEKTLVADVSYYSAENLEKCEEERIDAYIPDNQFRKRDPRFATQERWSPKKLRFYTLDDFRYIEATDEYLCPQGKKIKFSAKKIIMDGIIYRRYRSEEDACEGCETKERCIKGRDAKRRCLMVPIGIVPGNLRKEMVEKIDSENGRRIYNQRIGIVEPVFANIRHMKRLDRFTLRGKIKVDIQWMLYCMVHNIGKIMRYGFT
jgi:transposase